VEGRMVLAESLVLEVSRAGLVLPVWKDKG